MFFFPKKWPKWRWGSVALSRRNMSVCDVANCKICQCVWRSLLQIHYNVMQLIANMALCDAANTHIMWLWALRNEWFLMVAVVYMLKSELNWNWTEKFIFRLCCTTLCIRLYKFYSLWDVPYFNDSCVLYNYAFHYWCL